MSGAVLQCGEHSGRWRQFRTLREAGEPAPAVRRAHDRVYFVPPPRLLSATTTQKATDVWGATIAFLT